MPTPFPGMDPYLERVGLWQQVHTALIVEIQQFLSPLLRPHYYIAINRAGIPDAAIIAKPEKERRATATSLTTAVLAEPIIAELPQPEEVKHRYLEIRDSQTQTVVTTIEILS